MKGARSTTLAKRDLCEARGEREARDERGAQDEPNAKGGHAAREEREVRDKREIREEREQQGDIATYFPRPFPPRVRVSPPQTYNK